jgi:hypothetical protein
MAQDLEFEMTFSFKRRSLLQAAPSPFIQKFKIFLTVSITRGAKVHGHLSGMSNIKKEAKETQNDDEL